MPVKDKSHTGIIEDLCADILRVVGAIAPMEKGGRGGKFERKLIDWLLANIPKYPAGKSELLRSALLMLQSRDTKRVEKRKNHGTKDDIQVLQNLLKCVDGEIANDNEMVELREANSKLVADLTKVSEENIKLKGMLASFMNTSPEEPNAKIRKVSKQDDQEHQPQSPDCCTKAENSSSFSFVKMEETSTTLSTSEDGVLDVLEYLLTFPGEEGAKLQPELSF